jgi:hypothetical protein
MKRPICGIASLLMPFLLYATSRAIDRSPLGEGMNGYAGLFLVGFMYISIAVGCLAGVTLGVVAWIRREPYRVLGAIGAVLNVVAWPTLIGR